MADGIMTCLLKKQRSQSSPGAINVRYVRAEGTSETKTTSLSRTLSCWKGRHIYILTGDYLGSNNNSRSNNNNNKSLSLGIAGCTGTQGCEMALAQLKG